MEAKIIELHSSLEEQTRRAMSSAGKSEMRGQLQTLIDGRFEVVAFLAKGGFGEIYRALDLKTKQLVVLKTIRPEQQGDEKAPVRFLREIRATEKLAKLSPHIVRFVAHGRDPLRGNYYAMEHLEGRTLRQLIDDEAPLPLQTTLHIIRQLCQVLMIAHREGIVHRDLKPDNIFLIERDGDPHFIKLLDFGLAKNLAGTFNKELTLGMLGSPRYMAPEQGYTANIDHRADQYALGLIAYEMLTQTHAIKGHTIKEVIHAQLTQTPQSLTQCCPQRAFPDGLEEIIFRAIAKVPEHRFRSVYFFWQKLSAYAHEETPTLEYAPALLDDQAHVLSTLELQTLQETDTIESDDHLPAVSEPTWRTKLFGSPFKRSLWCILLLAFGFLLGFCAF